MLVVAFLWSKVQTTVPSTVCGRTRKPIRVKAGWTRRLGIRSVGDDAMDAQGGGRVDGDTPVATLQLQWYKVCNAMQEN